jgi:hypothetical protein
MWVVALIVPITVVLVCWLCCYESGRAAQWEEDHLGVRRS